MCMDNTPLQERMVLFFDHLLAVVRLGQPMVDVVVFDSVAEKQSKQTSSTKTNK